MALPGVVAGMRHRHHAVGHLPSVDAPLQRLVDRLLDRPEEVFGDPIEGDRHRRRVTGPRPKYVKPSRIWCLTRYH